MNQITITTELCAEDRARLDRIIAALEARPVAEQEDTKPSCERCMETVQALADAIEAQPDQPTTAPEPEPQPIYKASDVQQKVVALSAAGKKAEVRAIVLEYAERVSGIPEDKYSEVMARLNELEG